MIKTTEFIGQCMNPICPNKIGEGRMVIAVYSDRNAPRDVILLLCTPCDSYMRNAIKQEYENV